MFLFTSVEAPKATKVPSGSTEISNFPALTKALPITFRLQERLKKSLYIVYW
jgi:hypothetical protein